MTDSTSITPQSDQIGGIISSVALALLSVLIVGTLAITQGKQYTTLPTAAGTLKIAFMSNRDGNWEIYLMNRDGQNPVNLTNNPTADAMPIPRHHHQQLAFASDRAGMGVGIYQLSLNQTEVVPLQTITNSQNIPTAWSPDGKYLVFESDQTGEQAVLMLNTETQTVSNLTQQGGVTSFGDWFADSTHFIAAGTTPTGYELFISTLDGVKEQTLTDGSYPAGLPVRSPNGEKIAFAAAPDPAAGTVDIFAITLTDSTPVNLTRAISGTNLFPRWSPDGRQIAFTSDRDGNSEIYVMNVDGSNLTNLTNNAATESPQGDFAWSPDGRQILFHSDRDGNVEVYVMNADGSKPVNLSNTPAGDDVNGVWVY